MRKTPTKPKAELSAAPAEMMTPEMQALAEAKKSRDDGSRETARHAKALDKAQAAQEAAQEVYYAAKAAVENAQESGAAYAVAAARGKAGKKPLSPREAREALQAAEEDLAIATAALEVIAEDRERSDFSVGIRDGHVKRAAVAVLANDSELKGLLADLDQAMLSVVDLGQAVEFLLGIDVLPDPSRPVLSAEAHLQPGRLALQRLRYAPQQWTEWGSDVRPETLKSWRDKFDALTK